MAQVASSLSVHTGFRSRAVCTLVSILLALLALAKQRGISIAPLLRSWRRGPALPSWPPPPSVLVRQGGALAAIGALLLYCSGLCSTVSSDQDEEGRIWVAKARKQRRQVLSDLLSNLPLQRLCSEVPGLQLLLSEALPQEADKTISDGKDQQDCSKEGSSNEDEEDEFNVTAQSIAEAAEELARVDYQDEIVWEGYAVASALTASELNLSLRKVAPPVKSDVAPAAEGAAMQPNSAELDVLQMRIAEAEELSDLISAQCPSWTLTRRITTLYQQPLDAAWAAVRLRRLAQWRYVAQLLWRFKSTLPFIGLSSVISVVLGAFSAMRLHYQAAVINIAKDTVVSATSASSAARAATATVGETVGAMIVSELITQMAEFGRARLASRGKMRVVRELKAALFRALLRQDLEYLESSDLYTLRSMIGSCGTTVGQVIDFPAVAVESIMRLLTALAVLWRKSPRLTSFLAVVLPVRFALDKVVDRAGERFDRQACLPDFRGRINACWSGLVRPAALRTMRAFAREPVEAAVFARFLDAQDRLQERGQLVYRLLEPLRTMLEHGPEIGTLWYGGQLALRGEVEFGDLSSFVLVAQSAFDGARFVRAAAANVSAHAIGPLSQMAVLLAREPRIGLDRGVAPDVSEVQWCIRFENVSFAYPQRPGALVLRGLSFEAREGEFLGILGTTGAGKSTVFALLLRFYDPIEGRILLGGRDLREYNPLWLRQHLGYVSQELVLCERTVRENLVYGCLHEGSVSSASTAEVLDVGDEQARAALRVAQCEDTFFDASAFPHLWHTDVGDSGSNLSGGERQRLAIARAVLKRSKLLLFDEATSALDELSQTRLQDALESVRRQGGMTTICIAHRLSNLAKADRLLVIEHGRAVEEGTPAELMSKQGGAFAEYARVHQESLPSLAGQ